LKCIITDLLIGILRCRCQVWNKESKILTDKLDKIPSKKKKKKKKKIPKKKKKKRKKKKSN